MRPVHLLSILFSLFAVLLLGPVTVAHADDFSVDEDATMSAQLQAALHAHSDGVFTCYQREVKTVSGELLFRFWVLPGGEVVRVLSALAPPALLLFGAAKLYEFLQRQEIAKQK